MSIFLTRIQVNKIFHLKDISINIDNEKKKHLILTGKNGSGKTSLLSGIADFLQEIKDDPDLVFLNTEEDIKMLEAQLEDRKLTGDITTINIYETAVRNKKDDFERFFSKVNLEFNEIFGLGAKLRNNDFLLSYYGATRKTQVTVSTNPEKPNLIPEDNIKNSKIGEFLKFLVDLKVQEALARNENQIGPADEIKNWFKDFTDLLGDLFEDKNIGLNFNYKDYSFTIIQGDRKFGFNELSDGYSAIIDIVADLIIKMQSQDTLKRAYKMEGIVLIDEIETHLHLKLQRMILPMLTRIFPNIQFVVTTHSPFVLNSISNAIAFDLEKLERLDNLTEYSYEALAEGYFKVDTDSGFLLNKLERFKELSKILTKDTAELAEYQSLDSEFASMDDLLTPPHIKGQYLQIKLASK